MMRQYELVERVRRYNPNTDEALLDRAYVYAMRAHGTQLRASGDPYFSHPLEVAAILTDLKLDDATIIAALLHDTIEDTGATKAEIEDFRGALLANPAGYIAQPTLSLSSCPTYVDAGIAPRHIDLRPFVLSGRDVQMVAGGLTRVALQEGSLVVNSSQGGGTKDTWVLGEGGTA